MSRPFLSLFPLLMVLTGILPARENPPPQTPRSKPKRIYYYPLGPGTSTVRPPITHGNNPRVRVLLEPRFDWSFALAPEILALTPRSTLLHNSTNTNYQLWVPRSYRHVLPHPLILFVSSKPVPDELIPFDLLCHKFGVLFAVAYGGGNEAHPTVRMQLTLDVLDDIRRRMHVDTDRIYVAGFSEGARTACELAYAYPEFVGGVLAIGGASRLRPEPWMRERAKERLSVALITGEFDPVRREIERTRFPVVRDLEIRSKLWIVPRLGHAIPSTAILEDAYVWLELARAQRRLLGVTAPTARMAEATFPTAVLWSEGILSEAKAHLKDKKTKEIGILQLEGLSRRWRGSRAADEAMKLLQELEQKGETNWKTLYEKKQLQYLALETKGLEEYLEGSFSWRELIRKQTAQRELMSILLEIEKLAPESDEGKRATERLQELRQALPAPPLENRMLEK